MSLAKVEVRTPEEAQELLQGQDCVGLYRDALRPFGLPTSLWAGAASGIDLRFLGERILELEPSDQIVVAETGLRIHSLQAALAEHDLCIPLGEGIPDWTLGEALALNLPHGLESQHGNWLDWVLGLRFVNKDQALVRLGSKAVKNVAGYDAHKMFIGARGSLGLATDVTLRVIPKGALDVSAFRVHQQQGFFPTLPGGGLIQRVRPSDFQMATEGLADRLVASDPASGTLWASLAPNEEPVRFEKDWVLRTHAGEKNLRIEGDGALKITRNLKCAFDPSDRYNPGELGL